MNHAIQGVTGYFFFSNSHPIFNIRDVDAYLVLQIPNNVLQEIKIKMFSISN